MTSENIARADATLLAGLGKCGVATVHEAQGRTGLLGPRIRPIYMPAKAVGTALTCEVAPGDNLAIHAAIEYACSGDVLVVSPTSRCTDGYVGDLLATSLRARGVVAVVIDAGVRDVSELRRMQFPIWSAAISAQGTVKHTGGRVQSPVVCGHVRVCPGDIVVADDDGVVIVPREQADSVLEAARTRQESETTLRTRLAQGELTLDILGLRTLL